MDHGPAPVAARRLYRRAGFRLDAERTEPASGTEATFETWSRDL